MLSLSVCTKAFAGWFGLMRPATEVAARRLAGLLAPGLCRYAAQDAAPGDMPRFQQCEFLFLRRPGPDASHRRGVDTPCHRDYRAPLPTERTFAPALCRTGAGASWILGVRLTDDGLDHITISVRNMKRGSEHYREIPIRWLPVRSHFGPAHSPHRTITKSWSRHQPFHSNIVSREAAASLSR